MASKGAEIAGGGIAGLFMAVALARRGWTVRVHECRSEVGEIGAGIYLSEDALDLFDRYGLTSELMARAVELRATERRERDGRLIHRDELTGGRRTAVLTRPDLVAGLAEAARDAGVEILTDSRVTALGPDGTLELESGDRAKADLVIAADGFRSALRARLGLAARATARRSGATRMLISRGRSDEADRIAREYWSGARRVGIAPSGPDVTYVYMSCRNDDSDAATIPVDVENWQRAFPALAGFLERLAGRVTATRHAYPYVRTRTWASGRAAIIGDAAHGMPPTLGQGAVLAMVNAHELACAVEKHPDVASALSLWERERQPIAARVQRASVRIDALTTKWPRAFSFIRRLVVRRVGWRRS